MASTISEPRIEFLGRPLRLYIDGAFVETEGSLATVNPATGEILAEAPLATEREVDAAVGAAARAFDAWRFTPADPAGPAHLGARRSHRGEQGGVRHDRGPRQRQADVGGGGGGHRPHDRAPPLLRRMDDEDRRQGPAQLDPGDVHRGEARARGRRRRDHPVELPLAGGRRTSSAPRSRPGARS